MIAPKKGRLGWLAILTLVWWLLPSASAWAAFALYADATYYTVDTDAGLVFKIRRFTNSSSTQSPGDIASLVYNGVEYQDQARGSQINSGFDFLGYASTNVTVTAGLVGTDFIKITVTTDALTHYYLARRGYSHIYMATYFTVEPVSGGGLCRYIMRLPVGNLPNGLLPGQINGTDYTVESGDIFGFGSGNTNVPYRGQTRSKHYSNIRLKDWAYFGATGNNVGVWMVRDNQEGGSGGPFYRSLLNQGSGDQELTYIVNYGETQTENFRTNILNSYTAVFTTGATPGPLDTSWFSGMNLTGYVPPTGRGTVTGAGITNPDTNFGYTVGFANATAQYFTAASAANGAFTMAGMLPGTYAMSIYKNELAVYVASVDVSAGGTTPLAGIALGGDPSAMKPLWRIGNWDGTPTEFLNGDKVTIMHPSDVRMSNWSPGTYVVGTSKPSSGMPCYQWKDINANQLIQFKLTADQIAASTVRVGLTTAYANARPNIGVNSWTAPLQGISAQPDSRTLTVGSYRGNNVMYTFNVPASALVVGTNTLTVYPISGSGGSGYLSAGYSLDCIDMFQGGATLDVPAAPSALTATVVNSAVNLNWGPVERAVTYTVSRGTVSGGPYTVIATDLKSASYTDASVQGGTTYRYVVRGTNSSGTGLPSAEASATTGGAAGGLVTQLRFDETTGLTAFDSTGNGWNGTLANIPSWTPGLFSGAVALAGAANSYLTLPDGVVGGLTNFTISGWVKLNAVDSFARIFDFGTATTPSATAGSYVCLMASNGNTVRYAITTAGYNNEQAITGTAPLPVGAWTHFAVTVSGSTGRLYVNGVLAGTNNSMTVRPFSLGMTTRNYLGKSQFADPYLNGSLDDFRIYNRALSAAELTSLAAASPAAPASLTATPGDKVVTLQWAASDTAGTYSVKRATLSGGPYTTVATGLTATTFTDTGLANDATYYYVVTSSNSLGESAGSAEVQARPDSLRVRLLFDEGSGAIAFDTSGDGNHAGTVNAPTWEAGKIGNALRLTQANSQYAVLPAGIVSDASDLTVMCWIKPASLAAWQRIFDFGADTMNYMYLAANSVTGKPRFGIRTTAVNEQIIDSSVALATGAWTHVAFVQSGTTGRLYFNGALVGTNGALTLNASNLGATTKNYIGRSQFPDPYLDASVDHFHVYGRALSAAEIAAAANLNPSAPSSLKAMADEHLVTLNWVALANATSYSVKRATASGGPYTTVASALANPTFIDTGLSDSVTYYYVVTSSNSLGESANSAEIQARPDYLRLRLRFDESNGSTAFDTSGDVNHAATANGPTWEAGKFNNALHLTASVSQYVSLPTGIISDLNDFTTSGWVKLTTLTPYARLFDFGSTLNPTATTGSYLLLTTGSNGVPRFAITTSGYANEQGINGTAALPTGEWVHLAVTLAGNTGRLYVNGVEVGSNTAITLKPANIGATPNNFLGRSQFSSDSYLDGALDDFRLYSRAMSGSEIGLLVSPLATPQNLVATSGPSSIGLTWNAVPNAASYTVKVATLSVGPFSTLVSGLTSPTYTHGNLPTGATRYYVVSASNVTGEGDNSNFASAAAGSPSISQNETMAPGFSLSANGSSGTATVRGSVVGHSYQLQYSLDLTNGSWSNVSSAASGTGGDLNFLFTPPTGIPRGFYRIRVSR